MVYGSYIIFLYIQINTIISIVNTHLNTMVYRLDVSLCNIVRHCNKS